MERRFLSMAIAGLAVERRGNDPPMITGLASVFYDPADEGTQYGLWDFDDDRCYERIMPSAFDSILANGPPDVVGLFNHDANCILGRTSAGTMKIEKTSKGLRYSITPPDCPMAQGVIQSIDRGDLRGSSFSFSCGQNGQKWIRQGKTCIREIHSVEVLCDVGPVTFPAYASTSAGTGSRSCGDIEEARASFLAWKGSRRGRLTEIEVQARMAKLGL